MGIRTGHRLETGLRLFVALLLLASVLFQQGGSVMAFAASGAPEAKVPSEAEEKELYDSLRAGHRAASDRAYVQPEQPTVYLTFDDGPSKLTEQVLDILREEDVKGTFFVVGQQAEQHGAVLKRVVEEGHAIGNHTYNHVYKELYTDFSGFWKQISKSEAIIENAAGLKPELIRAPGGTHMNFDAFYFYFLETAGYRIIDWNVDSGDAVRQGVPAEEIVRNVRKTPLKHEMVVLMHDGTGHEQTVKALPEIIRFYKEQGYAFAPIGPSVKPVQFTIGKDRWNRALSFADFDSWRSKAVELDEERQIRLLAQQEREESMKRQALLAAKEAQAELERQKQIPLSVLLDAGPWIIQPQQYEFRYDRFAVPLRSFVERIGGKVMWEERTKVAVVQYGAISVEIDPIARTVRERSPAGIVKTHYLADIHLVNGEIRVPLRATAELLGGRVDGYRLDTDARSVSVALSKGSLLVQLESQRSLKSFKRV